MKNGSFGGMIRYQRTISNLKCLNLVASPLHSSGHVMKFGVLISKFTGTEFASLAPEDGKLLSMLQGRSANQGSQVEFSQEIGAELPQCGRSWQ